MRPLPETVAVATGRVDTASRCSEAGGKTPGFLHRPEFGPPTPESESRLKLRRADRVGFDGVIRVRGGLAHLVDAEEDVGLT